MTSTRPSLNPFFNSFNMEDCTDCGKQNRPAPHSRKALFFDLDHSLIWPKARFLGTNIPFNASASTVASVQEDWRSQVPKGAVDVQPYQQSATNNDNLIDVGVSYRPTFPNSANDWEFLPGVVDVIRPFIEHGFMFILISNQGGIEAGFHTEQEVETKLITVLTELASQLGSETFPVDLADFDFFYCPSVKEHPDRKPNPGMILRAIEKHGIDAQSSYFVGDMESDYQAAAAADVRHYVRADVFIKHQTKPEIQLYE